MSEEIEKYKKKLARVERKVEILEEMLEEKVRELYLTSNNELEKKNKELEVKNKEMEQFTYIASHDLQEPLRTIRSFSEIIEMSHSDGLGPDGEKYLEFIIAASKRMSTLISDLLSHGNLGAKGDIFKIDLNELLSNVCGDLSTLIDESHSKITFDEMPEITGYSTELRLLFQNLLTNAIKFRRPNVAPIVHYSIEKKGEFYEFSVQDNGIGMNEKYFKKIFQIFQRLHGADAYKGNGIGLSHCKKIVELHKGEIWVESVEGEGSKFYFTLKNLKLPEKET